MKTLGRAIGVPRNDGVGNLKNVLRAAVVLFEENDVGVGIVLAKTNDITVVGAAEAINGLVFVADHKEVAPSFGLAHEMRCQFILGRVCVLEFIDENVTPLFLVLAADTQVFAQEKNRAH